MRQGHKESHKTVYYLSIYKSLTRMYCTIIHVLRRYTVHNASMHSILNMYEDANYR
jgi:hypothetical protein